MSPRLELFRRRCVSRRLIRRVLLVTSSALSLNFNITENVILGMLVEKFTFVMRNTPSRAALRGRVNLDLRVIEFVRMFLRDLNAICTIKVSPFFIRSFTEQLE